MTAFSRRHFVLSTAAALGASCLQADAAPADRRADLARYGGWSVGIHSYYLRAFDAAGALAQLRELGLHAIEISSGHYAPTQEKEAVARMDRLLAENDVALSAYGAGGFGPDHEVNTQFFWFARLAGVPVIVAEPVPESLDSVERLARQFNLPVLIHNRCGARYPTPEDCLRAVRGRDRHLGFVVDTGQYILSGVDPIAACEQLGERLYGVHVKDYARAGADAPATVLGEGKLDLAGLFKTLRKVGFPANGLMTLEHDVPRGKPADEVRRCLANLALAAKG